MLFPTFRFQRINLRHFLCFHRPMPSIQHAIYFWFSLSFLISRTLALSLFSSEIHDESKKPIDILRAVPTNSWSTEVRRFSEHVVNDTIALTGMRFFFLTRKLILSVAGTIMLDIFWFSCIQYIELSSIILLSFIFSTYELVLIQFRTEDSSEIPCRKNW